MNEEPKSDVEKKVNGKVNKSKPKKTSIKRSPSKNSITNIDSIMEAVSPFLGEDFKEKKTFNVKMSLMDLTRNNAMMLISHYKIENQDVINTAALALSSPENYKRKTSFNNKFGNIKSSLKELEPFQKLILEDDLGKMFTKKPIRDVFSNLENLDMAANAALQSLILTTAICLTGKMPAGLKMKVSRSGLSKLDVQRRLSLLLSVSQVLYQRSKDFKKLETNKFDKMHKDLLKIVSDF